MRLNDAKEKLLALSFAILPFLGHYVLPGIGMNLAYLLMLLLEVVYILPAFYKSSNVKSVATPIIFIMALYCMLNHIIGNRYIYSPTITNLLNIVSFFTVLYMALVIFKKYDNVRRYYYLYIENIAIIMSVIVFGQIIIYYVFHSTISSDRSFIFPLKSWLYESTRQYLSSTEMVINGLFRPSAFFLEPAHFAQFCTIGLVISLVEKKSSYIRAIIISAGLMLTTSGLGIVSVILIWGMYLYINVEGIDRKRMNRMVLGTLLFVGIFIILFSFSASFQFAVMRMFIGSNGYHSAIQGRTTNIGLIALLSSKELIYGMDYANVPTYGDMDTQYYLTGIFELIYCQGILGASLFIICYFYMIIKTYKAKQRLPLYILISYLPFLFGSSNLAMLVLVQYLPFLYIPKPQKLAKSRTSYKMI